MSEEKVVCCEKFCYEITHANLPLSCPLPDMRLWDAHPRVYLPIEETGYAICPYCSALFILKDWKKTEEEILPNVTIL